MDQKEYEDMIISERIQMILHENRKDMDDGVTVTAEQALSELDEEQRRMMEDYLDRLIVQQAEHEKEIYLGGIRDGIAITRWIMGDM